MIRPNAIRHTSRATMMYTKQKRQLKQDDVMRIMIPACLFLLCSVKCSAMETEWSDADDKASIEEQAKPIDRRTLASSSSNEDSPGYSRERTPRVITHLLSQEQRTRSRIIADEQREQNDLLLLMLQDMHRRFKSTPQGRGWITSAWGTMVCSHCGTMRDTKGNPLAKNGSMLS